MLIIAKLKVSQLIHLGDVDVSHIGKQVVIEFEFVIVEHLLD